MSLDVDVDCSTCNNIDVRTVQTTPMNTVDYTDTGNSNDDLRDTGIGGDA